PAASSLDGAQRPLASHLNGMSAWLRGYMSECGGIEKLCRRWDACGPNNLINQSEQSFSITRKMRGRERKSINLTRRPVSLIQYAMLLKILLEYFFQKSACQLISILNFIVK
ncbi:hypothetical protein, partial [Bilophila wadsworthia]|uniref:hypothetical protein n=1 Tax=Bilophila wadsworthia TaxID=35833 RepID=UPI003AF0785A